MQAVSESTRWIRMVTWPEREIVSEVDSELMIISAFVKIVYDIVHVLALIHYFYYCAT